MSADKDLFDVWHRNDLTGYEKYLAKGLTLEDAEKFAYKYFVEHMRGYVEGDILDIDLMEKRWVQITTLRS